MRDWRDVLISVTMDRMSQHSDPATTPSHSPAPAPIAPDPAAPLWRRAAAELVGTGLLLLVIVGSGIYASRLSPGDVGLQLLYNALATAFGLGVLIVVFQQLSGAHFNPVVTLAERALGATRRGAGEMGIYIAAQVLGGIGGVLLANAMFAVPLEISTTPRAMPEHLLSEVVATAGLVLVIFALARSGRPAMIGPAVGAYIGAGYWFASSSAFANPAVSLARIFTDTFSGIEPESVLPYVGAELVGAAVGVGLVLLLFKAPDARR